MCVALPEQARSLHTGISRIVVSLSGVTQQSKELTVEAGSTSASTTFTDVAIGNYSVGVQAYGTSGRVIYSGYTGNMVVAPGQTTSASVILTLDTAGYGTVRFTLEYTALSAKYSCTRFVVEQCTESDSQPISAWDCSWWYSNSVTVPPGTRLYRVLIYTASTLLWASDWQRADIVEGSDVTLSWTAPYVELAGAVAMAVTFSTPPDPPTALAASLSGPSISLSWLPSPDAGVTYRVYYRYADSESPSWKLSRVLPAGSSSPTIIPMWAECGGQTAEFMMTAVGANYTSVWSDTCTVAVPGA